MTVTAIFTDAHGHDHQVVNRTALISPDGVYRWRLTRVWRPISADMMIALEQAKPGYVAWLMLNPSTADGTHDDPTITRCMKFSASWGYMKMVIVNMYPFRSSSPAECKKWLEPWLKEEPARKFSVRDALQRNLEEIEEAGRSAALNIVAFGANPFDHNWLMECLDAFERGNEPLHCLGVNAIDFPLHPMARGKLRIPDDQPLYVWR